jgi:hypothetical protein
MPATFEALSELCSFFEREGIRNLVYGGWALDIHVGRVTREHEDIDHFIPFEQREYFLEIIRERHLKPPTHDGSGYTVKIIADEPAKTVWETSIVPGSYVETHYFKEDKATNTMLLGYPKDWMRVPLDRVATSVEFLGRSIPVVCKELVVAMNDRWCYSRHDQLVCEELRSSCDPKLMSRIELKEFFFYADLLSGEPPPT